MGNTITYKPDGLAILEDIHADLLSSLANSNNSLSIRILNNLLEKINIAIQVIKYKPRLPLYQIEENIIKTCKDDNTIQRAVVDFRFVEKFKKIDLSRAYYLTINI
ncbi:hypothetical protein [Lacinutrix sp. Bg11-31]|uniref:hypothetical protein n=1 Tax=Lacinutrix sp. Bg11-31 TaxID=2057808 RepID=UPI000C312C10|nr:hypothetical protein [Lacinutrix sp. Bg11-31]AUC82260.1 hypothetical protein CW733_09010 [Lacinutrix sp. Bg11-31]